MFRVRDTYGKHRYAGRSKAKVIDNRDPANKGRIQIRHPILGETVWVDYLRQPNQFDVPSIGHIVYVECDTGEHEFPVAHGNLTMGYSGQALLPDAFKRNVPSNRGLFSPKGHLIEMDDGESNPTKTPIDTDLTTKNRGIRITSSQNNKIHIIEDSDSSKQYILIEDKQGSYIKLDYQESKLTINAVGDQDNSVGGASITTVVGNTTVTAGGQAKFSGDTGTIVGSPGSVTQVEGSQVLLGGGGPGVARLGDRAFGIGNLGSPVSSTLIQGSTKVSSG